MSKNATEPNIIAETFIVTFKIFLALYIATIVVIAVLYYKPSSPPASDTRVEITQTGNRDIHQEIKN